MRAYPAPNSGDCEPAVKAFVVTNLPVLNIFLQPSLDVEVVSQTIYGTVAEVLAEAQGWIHIRTADRYMGWAPRKGFLPFTPNPAARFARVVQLSTNVYAEPDVKRRAPLMNLPWEAQLELPPDVDEQASGAEWLPVRLLDGRQAFVLRGDVSLNDSILGLEDMLALARRFLGITYTWGGTSSFGFDCSGFVQMLFRQLAVLLPRDAQAQCDWQGFRSVERHALQPGDVLFFGDNPQEITHVGIFLGGDRFLHDSTHGSPGIQISSLADDPWHDRLTAQRRLQP